MLATDLYRLAKKAHACHNGLAWLAEWIDKHPTGTASQFFLDQRQDLKAFGKWDRWKMRGCSDPQKWDHACYLTWVFDELLDWSEFPQYWQRSLFIKEHLAPNATFSADSWDIPMAKLCQALANAFED